MKFSDAVRRPSRRRLLLAPWLALGAGGARALQQRSLADPLRVGVDDALLQSGLAAALQRGFGRDTGVAAQLIGRPALPLLDALERGELDAALCNVDAAESRLDAQGLIHSRRLLGVGSFVLVGPAVGDPAGIAGLHDAALALARIRDAAQASPPGRLRFASAGDGSGTHAAEQALWRAARIAPEAPWYLSVGSSAGLLAPLRDGTTYALLERGVWLAARGVAGASLLVDGDPRLAEPIHAMLPFRAGHPAGRLFVEWVGGARGRRLLAAQAAYR